eukprot:TCONS_00056047-protein
MASTFTDIVAAKKLASIKKAYKLPDGGDSDELTLEEQRKLDRKVEKESEKRLKQKEKREEQYSDREREREKLRSRIRAKYDIGTEKEQEIGKKKNKKKGDLKEKDFYKYNKAMSETSSKKQEKSELESTRGESMKFSSNMENLADHQEGKGKDKTDCIIS